MKKVSVIIPSKNRGQFLSRAVNSVDRQNYNGIIELIIIDDNSDVPIKSADFDINNVKIKIFRNKSSLGGAVSRNIGIDNATGDYLCFLDDDDEYYLDKLSVLSKYLDDNTDVDVVFGKVVRDDGMESNTEHTVVTKASFVKYLHTNTSLIRREVVNKVRFYETLSKYQDTQFHIELIKTKLVHFINYPVSRWYQNHGGAQITQMKSKSDFMKTTLNFKLLIQYLKVKGLLSKKEFVIFNLRLLHLRIKLRTKGLANVFVR